MKKITFFLALLFGLTLMTSCSKDDDSETTDSDRFIGTWTYSDPSAKESSEVKQIRFTFKKDKTGAFVFLYGDNSRANKEIERWWVIEEEQKLKFETVEYIYTFAYEFDGNDLLLDLFDDGYMYLLEKQ